MEQSQKDRGYVGMSAVIDRFGESFVESRPALRLEEREALHDLQLCGSGHLGGSVYRCDHCGHHAFAHHSCSNRSCPRCSSGRTRKWLESRSQEVLPVQYFQAVFTLPAGIRAAVKAHSKELYGALFRAAAASVQQFFLEEYGVKIGLMAVLHTWNRQLQYHPHVHCVATSGGLTKDGVWKPLDLDPEELSKTLRVRFRKAFIKLAEAAVPGLQLPKRAVTRQWYVYVDKPRGETDRLLAYLGRYVYRTALSDRRILAIDGDNVKVEYTPNDSDTPQVMELSGHEFLERFLQHIPSKGFHRVRYYGLWSPANRKKLRELQKTLPPQPESTSTKKKVDPDAWKRCPRCHTGVMEVLFTYQSDFDVELYVADANASLVGRPPPPAALAA